MLLRLKKEKGVAAVEFALLLPLLVMFVFAIIEFGPAFLYKISFTQAARQVARMAALEVPSDIYEHLYDLDGNDLPDFEDKRIAIQDSIPEFAGHPVYNISIVVVSIDDEGNPILDDEGNPIIIDRIGQLDKTIVKAQYDFTIPFMVPRSMDIVSFVTMAQQR